MNFDYIYNKLNKKIDFTLDFDKIPAIADIAKESLDEWSTNNDYAETNQLWQENEDIMTSFYYDLKSEDLISNDNEFVQAIKLGLVYDLIANNAGGDIDDIFNEFNISQDDAKRLYYSLGGDDDYDSFNESKRYNKARIRENANRIRIFNKILNIK